MNKLLYLALLPLLFLYSCDDNIKSKQIQTEQPYLVMLSLDGFRWDYPQYAYTPVLDSLKKEGITAESLKPAFPTKTFPNHYTIATGLYPDHHGIVSNSFYDPEMDKYYWISNREAVENGDFYGGEPIWVTAEKQNVRSATLFWVGSEAEINDYRPSIWARYDHSLPYTARIDSIHNWLSLPENKRPRLIMWYIDEPDWTAHEYGPMSKENIKKVESLDSLLGHYFHLMRKLPHFDKINFIITSDHGMAECTEERVILIDQYVDTADIAYFGGLNPITNIKVKEGKLDKVYEQLSKVPHLYAWKHNTLPSRFNYGTHVRTKDITAVAYPGWTITTSWKFNVVPGMHGYDHDFKDMHAIFYAAGPAFKKGFVHPTFENVNIYPLIAEILTLTPVETDGDIANVKSMLKSINLTKPSE